MTASRVTDHAAAPLRFFRDDAGSTSFSILVSVALVLAITALSAQLYWIESSSASIQTVADAGALAAASMSARVIMVVQVLDAILLSMNLVGLVMHFVVVIAAVASVYAPPAVEVFEQMRSIDKAYRDIRLDVADAFIRAAENLNEIAPYLAVANSAAVVAENSGVASAGSNYVGMAIPVPFKGDLESDSARQTMTTAPDEGRTLAEETRVNRDAAREAKAAKERMDLALKKGFEADGYKSVPLEAWNFEVGKEDFLSELQSVLSNVERSAPDFNVDDYRATSEEVHGYLCERVASWQSGCGFEGFRSEQYFYREKAGERYHSRGCKYLNVANSPSGEVAPDVTGITLGDCSRLSLLPCGDSQDAPRDWRALEEWDARLGKFRRLWSDEVHWHDRYEEAVTRYEKAVRQQKSRLEGVDDAFEDAKAKLLGRRLTYEPCGSKGFICVVTQTNSRRLPSFTFPMLTGSDGAQTGLQVAMAAAKVLPADSARTMSSIMDGIVDDARTDGSSSTGNLLAFVRPLSAGSDLVFDLWDAALAFYTSGISGLKAFVHELFGSRWIPGAKGLKDWAEKIVDQSLVALNVSPPELRQPQPVLVNTRFVLDDVAGGVAIVKAKDAYFRSGGATVAGIRLLVSDWASDVRPSGLDDVKHYAEIPVQVRFKVLGRSVDLHYVLKLPLPAPILTKLRMFDSEFQRVVDRIAVP